MAEKKDKPRCVGKCYDPTGWHHYNCTALGKVERDGKWYCLRHDPVRKAEREERRLEKAEERKQKRKEEVLEWARKRAREKAEKGIIVPCPFCGGDAVLRECTTFCYCECFNSNYKCGILGPQKGNKTDAIAAWNHRIN